LQEKTTESEKLADVAAKKADKSNQQSQSALESAQQQVRTVELAKNETIQLEGKVAQAEERIDDKIARIEEKES